MRIVELTVVEPAKIVIFLLFFGLFLLLVRKFFPNEKRLGPGEFPAQFPPDPREDFQTATQPAVIGAELPFPISLPEVQRLPNGRYNRPKVLNYYFSNLDLKSGPENQRVFCDQLYVQFEAPETGTVWTSEYTIASPFGLQQVLDDTGQNLTLEGTVIVVPRWDMALIMKTVLDDVMDKYADSEPEPDEAEDSTKRYRG